MNSHKKGSASGFKLESLARLLDLKSRNKKQSLLDYIAQMVAKTHPESLSFHDDLEIEGACSGETGK